MTNEQLEKLIDLLCLYIKHGAKNEKVGELVDFLAVAIANKA